MWIKSTGSEAVKSRLWGRRWLWLLGALLFVLYTSGLLAVGVLGRYQMAAWLHQQGATLYVDRGDLSQIVRETLAMPGHWLGAHLRPARYEHLDIDVSLRNWKKIQWHRNHALQSGFLLDQDQIWVPATIRYQGRALRAQLRLKGDLDDHIKGRQWSLRIHVKDGQAILGMRRFSLVAPYVRSFLGNALYYQSMKAADVLAPRYDFVKVRLNGSNWGFMAMEEHCAKELL